MAGNMRNELKSRSLEHFSEHQDTQKKTEIQLVCWTEDPTVRYHIVRLRTFA